jgi:hypothetical protein
MLDELTREPIPEPRAPMLLADPTAVAAAKYAAMFDWDGQQVGDRVLVPEGAANVALPMVMEGKTVYPTIFRADTGQILARPDMPIFVTPGTTVSMQCDFATTVYRV